MAARSVISRTTPLRIARSGCEDLVPARLQLVDELRLHVHEEHALGRFPRKRSAANCMQIFSRLHTWSDFSA